jgi:1-acyl-sn-glycerol-3-phosphate acyltransferase
MTVDTPVLLLDHAAPIDRERTDRWPTWKTMAYTLDISLRFLASSAVGRGSIARADELIAGYWTRILRSGNASLSAAGREKFPPGQPCVVMSNHSSLLDIPALMGAVPGSVRMVTKEELTKVPIWGQALVKSGFIAIDRKNREKAIAQLEKAKKVLAQGVHVWIAPEGTRSRSGALGAFKKGGFHVAMDLAVPIIPCWIHGANEIIPPDSFTCRYGRDIVVRFGDPIPTAGRSRDDMDALMLEVREAMVALSQQN